MSATSCRDTNLVFIFREIRARSWVLGFTLIGLALSGCEKAPSTTPALPARRTPVESVDLLARAAVGTPASDHPWIAHVTTADLERDGSADIVACDAKGGLVVWLRPMPGGGFEETTLASGLAGPVHAEIADGDGDGDADVFVACMGVVLPNNDLIGAVVALENDGKQKFTARTLLEHVARVTDVRAGDFNADGRLDLAVAQFGYDQGEIRWMQNVGPWKYESHTLLALSGAINVCVADLNGDQTLDIVGLVSQQWEEIHLFANQGAGTFERRVIFGSTNADFGSSGISLCDLNRDGRPDILYSNGDGFDLARPGPRSWHGVQWLRNEGHGSFSQQRIGDLPGAYAPTGVDFDRDGAMDVIAVSCFADWSDPAAVSLMWFRNNGRMEFTPHVLARTPTHLLTLAVLETDVTRQPALVTGSFHAFPPFGQESRLTWWTQKTPP